MPDFIRATEETWPGLSRCVLTAMTTGTAQTISVKVGTGRLCDGSSRLSRPGILELVRQMVLLWRMGRRIVFVSAGATAAGPGDRDTEWLALILGIRVLPDLDAAIAHSTAIPAAMGRFLNEVDSAAVYANAPTRFTDGRQLGLGAGIAISTQKLHARGPIGPEELTTYKWIIIGENRIRA